MTFQEFEVDVDYIDREGTECSTLLVVGAHDRDGAERLATSLAEDEGWTVEAVAAA